MDEPKFKQAFRNVQTTMAVEGLELPDSAFELLRRVIVGEISDEEFREHVNNEAVKVSAAAEGKP